MARASPGNVANKLLAKLPPADFQRIEGLLEPVAIALGESVYEAGVEMQHLYFPVTGIVSMLQVMENGSSAEIAVVGSEGVVGIAMFMGGGMTPSRAIVQSACRALRMPAAALHREFARGGELQHLLLRYTQALVTQMSQTAVCNRHHSVDQQLARWLLMVRDRVGADRFRLTHEFLAVMLGVRRAGVTSSATALQRRGPIRYRRGNVEILDVQALRGASCACYRVIRKLEEEP